MKRFKKIYIEITNKCNLNCDFCPGHNRAVGEMSLPQFEYIAQKIKPYTDYVYLHLMGEPLTHSKFKEILEICRENKLYINVTTNGSLIKNNIDMLAAYARKVSISLHSFIGNGKKDLSKYIDPLLELISKRGEAIIELRLWTGKSEDSEVILQYLEDALNKKIDRYSDCKLEKNLYVGYGERFEWPNVNNSLSGKNYCLGLRDQIGILCDGMVVPCCLDSNGAINLGNIFNENLDDILLGERAKAIFNGFSNNKAVENLCRHCSFKR